MEAGGGVEENEVRKTEGEKREENRGSRMKDESDGKRDYTL
jgi:hypothetical protein